jgi:hypothetical protein
MPPVHSTSPSGPRNTDVAAANYAEAEFMQYLHASTGLVTVYLRMLSAKEFSCLAAHLPWPHGLEERFSYFAHHERTRRKPHHHRSQMSPIATWLHHVAGINLLLAEVPQEDYSELAVRHRQASEHHPRVPGSSSPKPRRRMAISQPTVLAIYGFERHCETAATTWDDVIRMAAVQDLHSAWQEGQKNRATSSRMMLPA